VPAHFAADAGLLEDVDQKSFYTPAYRPHRSS
jgi:hypothetical protein